VQEVQENTLSATVWDRVANDPAPIHGSGLIGSEQATACMDWVPAKDKGINHFFFFLAFFLAFFLVVFFLAFFFFFERQPQVLHIFVSPTLGSLNQNPLTKRMQI